MERRGIGVKTCNSVDYLPPAPRAATSMSGTDLPGADQAADGEHEQLVCLASWAASLAERRRERVKGVWGEEFG